MIENFLREYAKLIVDFPEKINITRQNLENDFAEIIIYVDPVDTGKLIGKNGKLINAIKTVIMAYKVKDDTSYRITVKAIEE